VAFKHLMANVARECGDCLLVYVRIVGRPRVSGKAYEVREKEAICPGFGKSFHP